MFFFCSSVDESKWHKSKKNIIQTNKSKAQKTGRMTILTIHNIH